MNTMKKKRVGLIGLGDMGMGMARNLQAAGFPLIGLDLRPERMALLRALGGAAADNAAQLGRASDVVILMVFSGQQTLQLLQSDDGLLTGMGPGSTVIICSTIGPGAMRAAAELLADSGLRWLDCPVSGGRAVAGAGALGLFAAGTAEDVAAQRDVLEALGERIIHVGEEAGLGQALKAATLAFYAVSTIGLLEALALGANAGVSGQALQEVFGGSSAQADGMSHFREVAEHVLARRFEGTDNQIAYTVKDLELCMAAGRESGTPLFVTGAAYELVKAACARYPDEDKQSVMKILESLSGVTVAR